MSNTTEQEVTTRPEAGKTGIVTNLTIDWESMAADDIRALAQQALIVKLQSAWRKNGIPAGDHTVNAADYKVGVRAPRTPQTLDQMIKNLSPEEKAALLAKLAG
jgi:hypothetical protein